MSYVLVRMYSGNGARNVDDLLELAGRELVPLLSKAGGLQRYTTFKLADGRFGSTSLYQDKNAAERGLQAAAGWVQAIGAMQGRTLDRTLRGERIFVFEGQGNQTLDNAHGVIRIYRSTASAEDVKAAMEQEAQPLLKAASGLLRYNSIRLDDASGYAVITTHSTRESASQLTERAREARSRSGSRLQQTLPKDPEVLEGTVVRSYTV